MSKETTAALMGVVTANVSPTQIDTLKKFGTVSALGTIAYELEYDKQGAVRSLKKVTDIPVDRDKVQVLGNILVSLGVVKQRITLFYDLRGRVFASSNIKSGTGWTHHLPIFSNEDDASAWQTLLKVLPKYLTQAGQI